MVKNPTWWEADQLATYKRGRGVELGAAEKQHQRGTLNLAPPEMSNNNFQ